jgi:hypothetical protein
MSLTTSYHLHNYQHITSAYCLRNVDYKYQSYHEHILPRTHLLTNTTTAHILHPSLLSYMILQAQLVQVCSALATAPLSGRSRPYTVANLLYFRAGVTAC